MMLSLTRQYRFSASHRLHSERLTPEENARLFGKCNNPFGHGHNYTLEVTAAGTPDRTTGLLLPVALLDQLVSEQVLRLFAWSNLNELPLFDGLPATTENVALVMAGLLREHWHAYLGGIPARLARIYIQETERNSFELHISADTPTPTPRPVDA